MKDNEEIDSFYFQTKILKTLEQIKHLNWKIECIKESNQIGKWMAIWKNNQTISSGYYFEEKIKQGIWKEAVDNYWSKAEISYIGMYQNNKRNELWKIMLGKKQIGGGQYNEQGMKYGKWIEQSDDYWIENQVTYNGEYIDGKKYGLWNILYRQKYMQQQLIFIILIQFRGGGVYDKNELKNGNWVDLCDGFCDGCQFIFTGKYNNGLKCGIWNSIIWHPWRQQFDYIGGGQYDVFGMKDGNWVELKSANDLLHIMGIIRMAENMVDGTLNIKGNSCKEHLNNQSGGGNYYDNEIKNGKWIEISDSFMMDSQIIYKGEYKNSQKFGKWNSMFRFLGEQNFLNCGGGSYDENGQKTGSWIELSDNFSKFIQITFEGEYLNGKKIQKWKDKIKKIGSGLYDKNGMKDGKWVEMVDNFLEYKEITCNGKYNEGRKQGRWDYKIKNKEYIGGGYYNQNGKKNGKWVDLGDYFKEYLQIIWIGEYDNGEKCGKWEFMSRADQKQAFVKGREEFYEIANKKK
ncbi:unnamed protein product [Paramecium pentaurelia]|uniref:Uncharacterized protein n=1 Tax=Paramecium pentaurelia TaxID=43138 RepID=A0A8S1WQ14_9CILI|nr:unnamed protein product [Paramecium pentaurelia]